MNIQKKSLFMVLIFVLLVVSLGACAPAASEEAAPVEEEAAPVEEEEEAAPVEEEEEAAPVEEEVEEAALPYEGVELTLASMTDQYVAGFRYLIPLFEEETGIKITMDELGYVDLYAKLTADFVGETASYDLMTMDIVWSGEYAENGYTLPLNDFMERDADELNMDDILDVMWTQGEWEGQYMAFPLGGYANVLNYRKDVFEEAGIEPPTTQEEMLAAAMELNDPDNEFYGIAMLGGGVAGAQDYMVWVQQHGGTLLDADGNVKINTAKNVEILEFFGSLFDYGPPGSTGYWWGDRETAFRDGNVAMMEGWSIARNDYDDAEQSSIVGKVAIVAAPVAEGVDAAVGFGGWGIGINADSDPVKQEAAWEFIKWLSSEEIQKEWVLHRGVPLRRSTMTDPEIVEALPWMPILLEAFENGDGDYRPRIPEYSILQDALGTYVSAYLSGEMEAQEALDAAQAQFEQNAP
ncbi:MAG: hypothetical protein B6I38_02410 [Anaerolineaceae bacterium 4572_5.1]|nr:MAG: hypothetical protein B6I38_02410 [Anaerolineaceae bacterium 4572_5.1]